MSRLQYWNRIFQAYVLGRNSQLSFWHGEPELCPDAFSADPLSGPYYMRFAQKADYTGPFDDKGVPVLNYHGRIGKQYNPIAITQYGLGHLNRYLENSDEASLPKMRAAADWLVENLTLNDQGIAVWMHHFDFEYTQVLKNPWYSGLAQGQGLSLLVRAYQKTQHSPYLLAADKIYQSFHATVDKGGVVFRDTGGSLWIEEYLTDPPTHILNGFIWALWGLMDYALISPDPTARELKEECLYTLATHIEKFDTGCWSLYDLSNLRLSNLASPFYHKLHLVQLDILFRLTGTPIFDTVRRRFQSYQDDPALRRKAKRKKALFKLVYF